MKKILYAVGLFIYFSSTAFAHPGDHTLVCQSAKNSGSKQFVKVYLKRANGVGWTPDVASLTVDGKEYKFTPTDENKSYGETIQDAPLGIIWVSFEYGDNYFLLEGIPSTVKAFDDNNNKPVVWNLKDDGCAHANGKAVFQGVFNGFVSVGNYNRKEVDNQILDCTLEYNSGMAC